MVTRTDTRHPIPVIATQSGVSVSSTPIPVNPWEGFYADVDVQICSPDTAGTYQLIRGGDNEVLDECTVLVNGNGNLRAIIQDEDKLTTLFVSTSSGTYDIRTIILRHRITGEV